MSLCVTCQRFVLPGEAHRTEENLHRHAACPTRPPLVCPACRSGASYPTVAGKYRCIGCDFRYTEADLDCAWTPRKVEDLPSQTGDRGPWVWLVTGQRFFPDDPRPEDLSIQAIARAIANEPRFGGQTFERYTVGEHCVRGSHLVEAIARGRGWSEDYVTAVAHAFLLHDAAEGLHFKDVSAPLKGAPWMAGYKAREKHCQEVIYDWAGVGDERGDPILKEVDEILRYTEQRDLQPPIPVEFVDQEKHRPTLSPRIVPIGTTTTEVELIFFERWRDLRRRLGLPLDGAHGREKILRYQDTKEGP
jgi:hypothetical protein